PRSRSYALPGSCAGILSSPSDRNIPTRTHRNVDSNRILIIDYGSQFTQLIARRIREERVYCEIHPPTQTLDWIREWSPKGIILSGGPSSVYGDDVPTAELSLLHMDIPVFGIC